MHYDILSQIKNAQGAKKEVIQTPYSNFDFAIARVLADAKYIKDVQKKTSNKKNFLEITLAYPGGKPALSDFKIFSTPGRRLYSTYRELKPIRQNYGMAILSTPKGILNNKTARKEKVGGEYLCEVW
jgi:small subunit ribosomal protein S8